MHVHRAQSDREGQKVVREGVDPAAQDRVRSQGSLGKMGSHGGKRWECADGPAFGRSTKTAPSPAWPARVEGWSKAHHCLCEPSGHVDSGGRVRVASPMPLGRLRSELARSRYEEDGTRRSQSVQWKAWESKFRRVRMGWDGMGWDDDESRPLSWHPAPVLELE